MLTRNLLKHCNKPWKLHNVLGLQQRSAACIQEYEVTMDTFSNGIRVATEQTCSPLACLSLFIETGPRYEPPGYNGINHFIEHLAFKGLTNMSKRQIQDFAEESGSRFDAHTSQEIQRYSVTCTADWIQQATSVLCGIVARLELDPCEVERERDNICMEMDDTDRNYRAIVFENLILTAFQGTTLGQRVVGSSQDIASFDGCYAQTYMCAQFKPWRIVFAASAPVPNGFICGSVVRELGYLPASSSCAQYGNTRYTGSSIIYRDDSKDFAHVAVALEAPGYLSDDYMGMLVLKNMVGSWSKTHAIFGAWPDMAARCADTELCHSFESFYMTYRDIGLWGVYFICRKLEPEDFLHNWQNVILSMSCHMSERDVERAKRAAKMELFRDRAGAVNSSINLGREIIYKGYRPALQDYAKIIDNLDKSTLQSLAYKTFYNKLPVMAAAGPTENIPDYNRLSASQYWIRW